MGDGMHKFEATMKIYHIWRILWHRHWASAIAVIPSKDERTNYSWTLFMGWWKMICNSSKKRGLQNKTISRCTHIFSHTMSKQRIEIKRNNEEKEKELCNSCTIIELEYNWGKKSGAQLQGLSVPNGTCAVVLGCKKYENIFPRYSCTNMLLSGKDRMTFRSIVNHFSNSKSIWIQK